MAKENKNREFYMLKYFWENTDDYIEATINNIVAYAVVVSLCRIIGFGKHSFIITSSFCFVVLTNRVKSESVDNLF